MARAALAIGVLGLAALWAGAPAASKAPETPPPAPGAALETPPPAPGAALETPAPGAVPEAEAPSAEELMRRADAQLRGASTARAVRMTIEGATAAGRRVIDFESWDDRRRDRSLLRILSPSKEAGTGFLRLPPNVWRYAPRRGRFNRIPRGELHHRWLGSAFTLDDWLHESSDVEDYQHTLLGTEEDADGREGVRAYLVASRRRAEAELAWGELRTWIEVEGFLPLRREFYTADGAKVRTLRFQDVRDAGGRRFPHRWVMTMAGERRRRTRVEFESIRFDEPLDDAIFSIRRLKTAETP